MTIQFSNDDQALVADMLREANADIEQVASVLAKVRTAFVQQFQDEVEQLILEEN